MATAIKAIPTLKGKEVREFLRHAEEAERNYKGTHVAMKTLMTSSLMMPHDMPTS